MKDRVLEGLGKLMGSYKHFNIEDEGENRTGLILESLGEGTSRKEVIDQRVKKILETIGEIGVESLN